MGDSGSGPVEVGECGGFPAYSGCPPGWLLMMAKKIRMFPAYVREHRVSPRRAAQAATIEAMQRQVAALIQSVLQNDEASDALKARTVNDLVRQFPVGDALDDCVYHSEGALTAGPETGMHVEHAVEVSEIVRHLLGYADAIHAAFYAAEVVSDPRPSMAEIVQQVAEAEEAGDVERVRQLRYEWSGATFGSPPPDYENDLQEIVALLRAHCATVLVTEEEHRRLGSAPAYWSKNTFGSFGVVGAALRRYRRAGIRVVPLSDKRATTDDLEMPAGWGSPG